MSNGWTTVTKKTKSEKVSKRHVEVPREEWVEWTEDERSIFLILLRGPHTATQIAKKLQEMYPEYAFEVTDNGEKDLVYTKEYVGNLLYDGDIGQYVRRIDDRRKDRLWTIKTE